MEATGLSLMCASPGVLTWSRTSGSTGLLRKKMPPMRSFFSRPGGFAEKRACNESLEISASPFTTRPARCCGVCATLWEPGNSSIRILEKFLRSATFPFWLMAMRPCVAMSIAAMVSRHPELDWQRAKRYAAEVGAPRMLYLALQLSESALGIAVPTPLAAGVEKDAPVRSLSLQVVRWLPQAGFAPPLCGSAPHSA